MDAKYLYSTFCVPNPHSEVELLVIECIDYWACNIEKKNSYYRNPSSAS